MHDPKRHEYMDLALSPVVEEDLDKLALFAETAGGGAALSKRRGEDLARAKVAAKQNQQRLEARGSTRLTGVGRSCGAARSLVVTVPFAATPSSRA